MSMKLPLINKAFFGLSFVPKVVKWIVDKNVHQYSRMMVGDLKFKGM
jgi:hypothetical protein